MKDSVIEKIKKIKIVICDVDGVLTNGSIGYGNYKDEYREFNVHDGFGFILLKKAGIKTAIITSKSSNAVQRRTKELFIDIVCQNAKKKLSVFKKVLKKNKLKPEEACYMGDDLLDLSSLKAAGFSVSVPQANEDVKKSVDYITGKNAGSGAFRELVELILKTQNKYSEILEYYSS
ncbi:MAG: HAD-IIIA family hydrolase [Candidatus Omnitrophica bacterium]|nr:HAD-IIIA family hydrolase [Candidatus Omnitrophota bacterium]